MGTVKRVARSSTFLAPLWHAGAPLRPVHVALSGRWRVGLMNHRRPRPPTCRVPRRKVSDTVSSCCSGAQQGGGLAAAAEGKRRDDSQAAEWTGKCHLSWWRQDEVYNNVIIQQLQVCFLLLSLFVSPEMCWNVYIRKQWPGAVLSLLIWPNL